MDIKHITSDSLRRLLSLTEKKDHLIKGIADVENEIASALRGAATSARDVFASINPGKAVGGKTAARKPAKAAKKSKMSPEGRARISAATKARWAARRAGNAAVKAVASLKVGKPAKAKKKGISPEGRAKLAAAATARWAAVRAAKAAGKPAAPAKARKNAKA